MPQMQPGRPMQPGILSFIEPMQTRIPYRNNCFLQTIGMQPQQAQPGFRPGAPGNFLVIYGEQVDLLADVVLINEFEH